MTPESISFLAWLGQGAVSLLFGILGGFVGAAIAILAVVAGLIVNPLVGLAGLFAAGVLVGIRHA